MTPIEPYHSLIIKSADLGRAIRHVTNKYHLRSLRAEQVAADIVRIDVPYGGKETIAAIGEYFRETTTSNPPFPNLTLLTYSGHETPLEEDELISIREIMRLSAEVHSAITQWQYSDAT